MLQSSREVRYALKLVNQTRACASILVSVCLFVLSIRTFTCVYCYVNDL